MRGVGQHGRQPVGRMSDVFGLAAGNKKINRVKCEKERREFSRSATFVAHKLLGPPL